MNKDLNIRDEELLLLGLCRLSFDIELKVRLKALAENMKDWSYFAALANAHGVSALVYNNLQNLKFLEYIPQDVADNLYRSMLMSISRNSNNMEALSEVLRLLNSENIKMVLLKGTALELMVYGNIGLRQMTDVDVLMTREDCLKTRKILMSNGFTSLPVKSVLHKPIFADIGKHLPTLMKNAFSFELHHELFGAGKNVLTKMLYDNSNETEIKGRKAYLPGVQLFFLYLVKHLYLHEMNNESQLRLYTDLVVLIEKYGEEIINYDMLEYAVRADISEIFSRRLEPLRDLWSIPFPDWINVFINKYYNPDSINSFISFLKSPRDNPSPDRARIYRQNLSEIHGFGRKILYVLGDLFPTINFMKKRYNCRSGWKAIIYYPLRWGKLWYLVKA